MSELQTIECKPSQWFKVRAIGVSGMLLFFTLWFFKDGYWGYRDKNEAVVMKELFQHADDKPANNIDFQVRAMEEFNKQEYTAESWAAFAAEQKVPVPEDRDLLPRDFFKDSDGESPKWPKEIINGYQELNDKKPNLLWDAFSSRTKLPHEPEEKLFDSDTIREQFIAASVTTGLLIFALFIIIRILGRSMKVTSTGYSPPGGEEIPFSAMNKLDKRKWSNKGLAVIHYEEGGETKKAKVDGMIYGQFKEEDGAPAEALFSQIVDNFKGEIIEIIGDEDDTEEEEGNSD